MIARAATVILVASLLACSAAEDQPSTEPTPVDWQEVDLPVPPGPGGRIAVRDAAWCAGTWYAVGGVVGSGPAESASRPAWWSSADGTTWTSRALAPEDFFAKGSVLTSVGCHGADVAALGGRPGGAHGFLRTSSWYLRDDGVLVDVRAAFTQYGGVEAVNAARIAGGPAGWTISGNRVIGAASWTSPDARDFELHDADPALRHDDGHRFLAISHAPVADGWVMVGSVGREGRGGLLAPQAWSSPDGATWRREEVPATDDFGDLERVVARDDATVAAVGLRGDGFGAWDRDADGAWTLGPAFGALDPDRTAAPSVAGLVATDDGLVAAVSDGATYGLWASDDGGRWRAVEAPPGAPTVAADQILTVASDGPGLLAVADDGEAGRLYWRR